MSKLSVAFGALIASLVVFPLSADEVNFFPPAPAASSVDNFDRNGFIIDGHRTFILSGSIHYARVPRALWYDRLLRLKRAGFNTVQTYVFWNYHEIREDAFDFTGEKDFEAFLDTAQKLGIYATVRVGPYACAEWDFGGYPLYLKFKPHAEVRNQSPFFQRYQDHWLSKILPIVAAHQISRGGNIIFLQLENEGSFWGAWTREHPNTDPYWKHLHDLAIENGIEIPFFMSGMHHGFVPLPGNTDSSTRVNPWYATEIWTGWYDVYGSSRKDIYLKALDFMTNALALGANGFNYYMLHGGSNFDYWNNNEDASTYDYGAAIGQAGDLRPMYYAMKQYNTFATSFADILENATGDMADYRSFVTDGYVRGVRKSSQGTIVFVQGSASLHRPPTIQGVGGGVGGPIDLSSLEVAGIVLDAPLAPGIKIIEAATPILGVAHQGKTTTLVVYGKAGDKGMLTLALGNSKKQLRIDYPSGEPSESFEQVGSEKLRVLALPSNLIPLTWFIGKKGDQSIVVGPQYVGEARLDQGGPSLTIERPYGQDAPSEVIVYGAAGASPLHLAVDSDKSFDTQPAPTLSTWQVALVQAEAQTNYDDSKWLATMTPIQMGADGDITSYAWYRSVIKAPKSGSATIHFAGATDQIEVYVNGMKVEATCDVPLAAQSQDDILVNGGLSWDAKANLNEGANTLAVFVSHRGRSKAYGYSGPINDYFPKGIFKAVTVDLDGQTTPVQGWKLKGGIPAPASLDFQTPDPAYTSTGPAFFQTSFTAKPPGLSGGNPILRFDSTGLSRGSLFLNGHNLGRYPDKVLVNDKPLPLYLPECWFNPDGQNTLVVFDEEGISPTDAKLEVEMGASREIINVEKLADPSTMFRAPVMAGISPGDAASLDFETDKVATASSCNLDNPPYYADDGQENTYWYPANPPTPSNHQWLELDLGAPQAFKSFEVGWSCPISHVAYYLEGSVDGRAWTLLADQRTFEADTHNFWKTLPVPAGTIARYIRLTLTNMQSEEQVGVNTLRTH